MQRKIEFQPSLNIPVPLVMAQGDLLDQLALSFVQSGYDLKQLCRTICNSRAWQLSSIPNEFNGEDEQNFARYYPRRLAAEVMLDAIS